MISESDAINDFGDDAKDDDDDVDDDDNDHDYGFLKARNCITFSQPIKNQNNSELNVLTFFEV